MLEWRNADINSPSRYTAVFIALSIIISYLHLQATLFNKLVQCVGSMNEAPWSRKNCSDLIKPAVPACNIISMNVQYRLTEGEFKPFTMLFD